MWLVQLTYFLQFFILETVLLILLAPSTIQPFIPHVLMELLLFRDCKENYKIPSQAPGGLASSWKVKTGVHTTMIQPGNVVPSQCGAGSTHVCACPLLRQGQELRAVHALESLWLEERGAR